MQLRRRFNSGGRKFSHDRIFALLCSLTAVTIKCRGAIYLVLVPVKIAIRYSEVK